MTRSHDLIDLLGRAGAVSPTPTATDRRVGDRRVSGRTVTRLSSAQRALGVETTEEYAALQAQARALIESGRTAVATAAALRAGGYHVSDELIKAWAYREGWTRGGDEGRIEDLAALDAALAREEAVRGAQYVERRQRERRQTGWEPGWQSWMA